MLLVLLAVRIVYILSVNPIGDLGQELLYLRFNDLKVPATFLLLTLVIEVLEFLTPLITSRGNLPTLRDLTFYLNALQALLLLAAGFLTYLVLQRYTQRGQDRRIRDSMETLAYLAGQRRRRSRGAGGLGRSARTEEAPSGTREK